MSKFTLKAAFISLMILAIFLGAWQLATQPKESAARPAPTASTRR
jgi:hypothetical protein